MSPPGTERDAAAAGPAPAAPAPPAIKTPVTVEEARLRTILDSMVEAVYVTDATGRVTLTNRALEALIARDVVGRRAKNVIRSKELKRAIRRARKRNQATDVELESVIGDKIHSFHAQVSPLPDGEGVVTVLHDVTRLREADRIRRDFVTNASHELRTPLTAIRGFAETLRDGAYKNPTDAERFLDAILRHAKRLQRLAEDITLLAQAEAPGDDDEPVALDVRGAIRECAASLESFAKERDVRLSLELADEPLVLELSGRAFEHIVLNLIENAIKYSHAGGEVVVAARAAEHHVVVEVRDRGVGIPEKYRERIFERFYRVDKGRSRHEGGTGLGLSIVRNLVRRMGGRIEVESAVDVGSTFRVRLPVPGSVED
ncbi:MAG: PAS domain-containing protein [Sandaracinaceae bacterium]|nr:PAS domain-containing protein [Sandaracinaceae bacterium]